MITPWAKQSGVRNIKIDRLQTARETKTEHLAQKLIEIPLMAITNSSETGDPVIDFFEGCGSILAAAEIAGQRCSTMAAAPKYCDVTVNRYAKMTGSTDHRSHIHENKGLGQENNIIRAAASLSLHAAFSGILF